MRLYLRHLAIVCLDLSAAAMAWLLAYWLRFNLDIPQAYLRGMFDGLLWVLPAHGAVFVAFGAYRGMWRYVGVKDLQRIVLTVGLAAALVGACVFMFQLRDVPRSVLLLHPILLMLAMGGNRFLYRAWKDGHLFSRTCGLTGSRCWCWARAMPRRMLLKDLSRSRRGGWWACSTTMQQASAAPRRRAGTRAARFGGRSCRPLGRDACHHRHAILVGRAAAPSGRTGRRRRSRRAHRTSDGGRPFWQVVRLAGAQGRAGRPARPRSDPARRRRPAPPADGQTGAGDRRGRVDRFGTVPPDRALCPLAAGVLRAVRVCPLPHRAGVRGRPQGRRDRLRRGRRQGRGQPDRCLRQASAGSGLPCRRLQACAADGERKRLGRRCATTCSAPGGWRARRWRPASPSSSWCPPTRR
jgi:hypothetical protein